jgi:hypothetical protein
MPDLCDDFAASGDEKRKRRREKDDESCPPEAPKPSVDSGSLLARAEGEIRECESTSVIHMEEEVSNSDNAEAAMQTMVKKLNGDGDALLEGLRVLHGAATAAEAAQDIDASEDQNFKAQLLQAYLASSPECDEVFRLLGTETIRDSARINVMFQALAGVLRCNKIPDIRERIRSLGTKLLRKGTNAVTTAVRSGKPRLVASALQSVAAAAALGVVQARDAWKRIAPLAKEIGRHLQVSKASSRPEKNGLRVEVVHGKEAREAVLAVLTALLEAGDGALAQAVLAAPTLLFQALRQLTADPPALASRFLAALEARVARGPDTSAASRAPLLGAATLEALTSICRGPDAAAVPPHGSPLDAPAVLGVRGAAHSLLSALASALLRGGGARAPQAGSAAAAALVRLLASLRSDNPPDISS